MGKKIRVFGIILAAGKGERFKKSFFKKENETNDLYLLEKVAKPKCFLELGRKKIIEYSIEKFIKFVDFLVIATPPKNKEIFIEVDGIAKKYVGKGKTKEIFTVYGGKTRWESFLNALKTVQILQPKGNDIIVEHDGARPLFSLNLLKKTINFAKKIGSAVPFLTPYETVRTIRKYKIKNSGEKVRNDIFLFDDEIDRQKVALIQTPQAFKYNLIERAIEFHTKKGKKLEDLNFTDLAGFIFASQQKIFGIKGERENIKITYFEDLKIAEKLIELRNNLIFKQ
jgi:2-C-methyl-D-erythritol 4-phosphate cytidylyltransferase